MTPRNGGAPENVIQNGAMLDYAGAYGQGYNSLRTSGNVELPYQDGWNVDPGRTGNPLVFGAEDEGSITKTTMREDLFPGDSGRPTTGATAILTVVAQTPPTGAFRPALCAPTKISHWVEDDMNLDMLPSHALAAGNPPPATRVRDLRYKQQVEHTGDPAGERIRSILNSPFRSYNAQGACRTIAEATTLLTMAISPEHKRDLAVAICQIGIDVFERAKLGGQWGTTQRGTGGVAQTGNKMALLVAGVLFDNQEMLAYGSGSRSPDKLFGEDVQIAYLSHASATGTPYNGGWGYKPEDEGMPEWMGNHKYWPGSGGRVNTAHIEGYRAINSNWHCQAAMAYHLWPALKAVHGNQAFFDYCDRMMERNRYIDGGEYQWMRGTKKGWPSTDGIVQSARPTAWAISCWDTYRTAPGMDPIWDWPAP